MPHDDGASRGVPLPTGRQWLIAAAVLGGCWLLWPNLQKPLPDSGTTQGSDPGEDPVASALDNLRAVEDIARSGPEGLRYLVASLADSNFRIRRNALLALRSMGPGAVEALNAIRDRMTDDDVQVRLLAVDAYWRIRRDPEDVATAIAPLLGDRATEVRHAAAQVLQNIGPSAIDAVLDVLRSDAPTARVPALIVLRRVGWKATQPQIDHVVRELAREPDLRVEALHTLASWGNPTPLEIQELLQHREEPHGAARVPQADAGPHETALLAVIRRAPRAENLNDVVDFICASQLHEPQWQLALAALQAMGPKALDAAPRLFQFMDDHLDFRCIDLAWTLLAIGADPREVIHRIIPLLEGKDGDLCFHAGRVCATATPDEACQRVSRLIPLLTPEKQTGRLAHLEAIWGLAPEGQEAVPALSRLLDCDQPFVAPLAARALGDIGPKAAAAIPALVGQLSRKHRTHDYSARCAFCEAIGKIGPSARTAVPSLVAQLHEAPLSFPPGRDLNRSVQRLVKAALFALIRLGDANSNVLSEIRRHLANEDELIQVAALHALARLTPDSPAVLASHWKWLHDNPGSRNRVSVIYAIGLLPGDRQDALAMLNILLTENDSEIKTAAAWSLGQRGAAAGAALPALQELLKSLQDPLLAQANSRAASRAPLADNPRMRLERSRWIDPEDLSFSGTNGIRGAGKSLLDVVSEAIKEIGADQDEPPPPALPN